MKETEPTDEMIAANFGYACDIGSNVESINDSDEEVIGDSISKSCNAKVCRTNEPTCNIIKPVASQILTVFLNKNNKTPIHIELDSGASINFCEEQVVKKYGFNISYNKQISKLGDGKTHIESIGEINVTFYRNNLKSVLD